MVKVTTSEVLINLAEIVQKLQTNYPSTLNNILEELDLSDEGLQECLDFVDEQSR